MKRNINTKQKPAHTKNVVASDLVDNI